MLFPSFQEASTAKYIVQQYIAATGGQPALSSVNSMCAIGEVRISASEFYQSGLHVKVDTTEELGGFVLWQKNPDLWWLEFVVSGCKLVSGSNGELSWRQCSNQQSPISKGAPRLLRRFLQVLKLYILNTHLAFPVYLYLRKYYYPICDSLFLSLGSCKI